MDEIIIFGVGQLAQLLHEYILDDSKFKVVAFTADTPAINVLHDLPVINFNEIDIKYKPSKYKMLIVIGYSKRNQKRKNVFNRVKQKGYSMINYIHPTSILHKSTMIGENCIILENNVFQPHVSIGNNLGMLSSNLVGHHVKIEDHCFLLGHGCVGGRVVIGSGSTIGMNSTIKQQVQIAKKTFVGANVFIKSNTTENYVYEAPDPTIFPPLSVD